MKLRIRPDPYERMYKIEEEIDDYSILFRGKPISKKWISAYHLGFSSLQDAIDIAKNIEDWSKKETIYIEQ